MRSSLRVLLATVALLVGAPIANAQQAPDPRVADLVRAGKFVWGCSSTQYIKDPVTGELRVRG